MNPEMTKEISQARTSLLLLLMMFLLVNCLVGFVNEPFERIIVSLDEDCYFDCCVSFFVIFWLFLLRDSKRFHLFVVLFCFVLFCFVLFCFVVGLV